jgi:hypothetical protein
MEFHSPTPIKRHGSIGYVEIWEDVVPDLTCFPPKQQRRSLLQPRPKSALGLSSVRTNRTHSRCSARPLSGRRRPSSSIGHLQGEKDGHGEVKEDRDAIEMDKQDVKELSSTNTLLLQRIDLLLESSKRVHDLKPHTPSTKLKLSSIVTTVVKVKRLSRKATELVDDERNRRRPKSAFLRVHQRLSRLEENEKERDALFQRVDVYEKERKARMKEQLGKLKTGAQFHGFECERKARTKRVRAKQERIQGQKEEIAKGKMQSRVKRLEEVLSGVGIVLSVHPQHPQRAHFICFFVSNTVRHGMHPRRLKRGRELIEKDQRS